MTKSTQADFTGTLQAATMRLWMHRKALKRGAVRIGFWPDGLVISANMAARNGAGELASLPPQVIPWAEVATIGEARLIEIVDKLCAPLYAALGMKPGEDDSSTALVLVGHEHGQVVYVAGFSAAEMGVPLVEVGGAIEHLSHLTPEKADEFADSLKAAAQRARVKAAAAA